jgi:hypothetical protein
METSFTLFLDRMYDPSVCPFCDGCSRDVQAVRHVVSLVCLISHIVKVLSLCEHIITIVVAMNNFLQEVLTTTAF